MDTICVTTVVDEAYQEFIPWFVYFANESYPSYHISVFLIGNANAEVRGCLDLLDGNFSLHENCFSEYPKDVLTIKCLRWTNDSPELRRFDYVYTGDIDIMLCREEPGLLQQHLQHCDVLGLPYSNIIRGAGSWKDKPRRFSGLHFVKKEWYDKMRPVMEKYGELLLHGHIDQSRNNEAVLYCMVEESGIGLPKGIDEVQDSEYRFRPHHGPHLRLWLMPNPNRKLKPFFPVTNDGWKPFSGEEYRGYFRQVKAMRESATYKRMYELLDHPRPMIQRMVQFYEHLGY